MTLSLVDSSMFLRLWQPGSISMDGHLSSIRLTEILKSFTTGSKHQSVANLNKPLWSLMIFNFYSFIYLYICLDDPWACLAHSKRNLWLYYSSSLRCWPKLTANGCLPILSREHHSPQQFPNMAEECTYHISFLYNQSNVTIRVRGT